MGIFHLAEHFVSINGEGQRAGELALFLRFAGCNLHCTWCDTMWANARDVPCKLCSTQTLLNIAEVSGVRNVTLTGGEPLLQENIAELITGLCRMGLLTEIETNGSVPLLPFAGLKFRPAFTMDYKLPSSGMEHAMCTENFPLLQEQDTVKFVCGSRSDLFRAKEIIRFYHPACPVYFSPVFGQIAPAEIVEFMKAYQMTDVRLQLQLHKFIWPPEKRGV